MGNEPVISKKVRGAIIDVDKCVELREKGCTISEIAQFFSCSLSSVQQTLTKYENEKKEIARFKKDRGHILAKKQKMILDSIDEKSLKKTKLLAKTTAFGILFDKERLETGQSTQNISNVVTNIVEELDRERTIEPPERVVEIIKMEEDNGGK